MRTDPSLAGRWVDPLTHLPSSNRRAAFKTRHHCLGESLRSLQLMFERSPFFGQSCFCDCCSLAPRDVSFCCIEEFRDDDAAGDELSELLDELEDGVGGGVDDVCA
jgi:hypothetical protein